MKQKKFKISLPFYLVLLLTFAKATKTLDCTGRTPTACKMEFSKQLDEIYQDLHIAAVRDIITTHKEAFEKTKSQLDANNAFRQILNGAINDFGRELELLSTIEKRNLTEISKAVKSALKTLNLENSSTKIDPVATADFETKIHNFKLDDFMEHVIQQFMIDLSQAWAGLYAALRPADFEKFPAYTEVNEFMLELGRKINDPGKLLVLLGARDKLSKYFYMPYLEEIDTLF